MCSEHSIAILTQTNPLNPLLSPRILNVGESSTASLVTAAASLVPNQNNGHRGNRHMPVHPELPLLRTEISLQSPHCSSPRTLPPSLTSMSLNSVLLLYMHIMNHDKQIFRDLCIRHHDFSSRCSSRFLKIVLFWRLSQSHKLEWHTRSCSIASQRFV